MEMRDEKENALREDENIEEDLEGKAEEEMASARFIHEEYY